ncbi:helix-turn-helix domain-containing protein [Leptospira kmetyi]|uniref:HTH cro/C1-type domain-containing protein n=1 Tax=Leptospira kmetyi TaxID=408139 RepID=A0ABX4N5W4_9LEPT|nr:helix-turn-helix transcriptional regulator [Leptospira kmetyi]PJZ28783.1 hypothetical protein CH378_16440 [Leptospira kmetyi]PJZ39511.1 hypothetical protein CH370_20865 [Leptospira kmetyi]
MNANVFGAYVREKREGAKVRLKELAGALDITSVYLSDIETGKRNPPSDEKLRLISAKLNIDYKDLKERAIKYRKKAEFDISDEDSNKSQLALKMARVWNNLSEEEVMKISRILDSIKERE